jgi:hypothetical protein
MLLLSGCNQAVPAGGPLVDDALAELSGPLVKGPMSCEFKVARICNELSCSKGPNGVSVTWNPVSGIYKRCDNKGCDSYEPVQTQSGEFTTLSFPEGGMMTKITSRGRILEVATLMNTAFVKHGQCSLIK